jgi:hypothetical protein
MRYAVVIDADGRERLVWAGETDGSDRALKHATELLRIVPLDDEGTLEEALERLPYFDGDRYARLNKEPV